MAVDVRLSTAVLLIFTANFAFSQEICGYMEEIPRPPTPDFDHQIDPGLTWAQRPLLPPDLEPREDICMDVWHPSLSTQVIFMEEEIEGDVPIAKLNYQGSAVPFVGSFLAGSFNRLGPDIRRIPTGTGDYYLVITERQDYETPGMQQYMFQIGIPGEITIRVSLVIVNIDDNPPRIEMIDNCVIPETAPMGLTGCTYNVTDADGRISTQFMKFVLESDRGDEEVFEIRGDNEPGEWFWMHMTLNLTSQLNFELNALHIFRVTALDSVSNNHTVTIMVQVGNVESRPPRWVEIFAMQRFDEKTTQQFTVRAIDGDTDINRPIFYRIETEPDDNFFRIETIPGGRNGSILYVSEIDRDELEREVFQLSIIAYKTDDDDRETFSISANVVIIVNDVNDQFPKPFQPEYNISILEETAMQINLENFGFHDRDLGEHAQYSVEIEAEYPEGAEAGFDIAPQIGYQRQSFILTTANHSMLDYEVEEFQEIRLKVVATDLHNSSHVGIAYINISLINWNDEQPIFEHDVYSVSFRETVGSGFHVADVLAEDRDIDDEVVYQLLGNVDSFLWINETSGSIYVTANDSFDYHRQNELFIQVRADDTLGDGPYHTTTTQLVIQLEDVNNTPPTLRLPRGRPEIEENVPKGTPISEEIVATDPDTTAELVFEIDWESSYATKQGRETPAREFHYCATIETIYPTEGQTGSAVGKLIVNEIRENVTIDFEEFEVLYLTIRVTDLRTELGEKSDEATFTIIIIDMNDNPPVWAEGTLQQQFRVREVSASGIVIGSVLATDIDGPLYNQVRYTIFPREGTPEDLVDIDFITGQLTVKLPGAIDADEPRDNLYYTLIASDKCSAEDEDDCPPDPNYFDTEGNITISIIDTNNKEPEVLYGQFNQTVYVYENATTGEDIAYVLSRDRDRDDIYHTVNYAINYAVNHRLRDFFDIDAATGSIIVNYTTHETLDRDGDEPTHTIFLTLSDNFWREGDGNTNQVSTEIEVILLDVNDNAPELPPANELYWRISENEPAGKRILPHIYAPDRDEPDTDNSRVGYAILNLTLTNREIEIPELFTMIQIENVTGELETTMHLQGYWGTYDIHILAYDHGHPQMSSNETYELIITPYNFHEPVFVFPQPNTVIRLARERISANGVLFTVDNDFLERIQATDEDGLHAGLVSFHIQGDSEATSFFDVSNDGENSGSLILLSTFEDMVREFTVTIRGTDGGTEPGPLYTDCTVTLLFVPTQGEPTFANNTAAVSFFEEQEGMLERFELPLATDLKNHGCESNCFTTYYSIFEGNSGGHFAVDQLTNEIFLLKELNRTESATHTLYIVATNSPTSVVPGVSNMLTVTVHVREANPRPVFESYIYTAGISVQDVIHRVLLTVHATHTEGEPITYTIDQSTMEVDPSLEAVKYVALVLNSNTGVLTLNIQPTASMHGIFEFEVVATDPNDGYDRTEVKVYLISSLNRVIFRFRNTMQQIEAHTAFIAQTFSAGFNMTCNIDQVLPATDSSGLAVDDLTEVTAHFIRNHVPVLAEEIERLRDDGPLLQNIQQILSTELVALEDFVTDLSPALAADNTQIILYVLIALTVVLAFMCLVLLITCIVRTKTLSRRLEALSTTKYGSVDSGLNRVGIKAPGTNKHTAEGSNPIWNETVKAPDFDAISDMSDDSDFTGIENLPQFRSDYFPPEAITEEPRDGVASHDNNFGFNTTPFSPQFSNAGYRR